MIEKRHQYKIFTFLSVVCLLILTTTSQSQIVNWVFLDSTNQSGTCASSSSYYNGELCYGLEYIPSVSGTISSYTFGFIADCISDELHPISNNSCSMNDNSVITDACNSFGVIVLNSSGNDGIIAVTANQPIILHQVCMDFHFLDTINIIEDPATSLTVSLDTPNGPVTDLPTFGGFTANYSAFDIYSCLDTNVCSIHFGLKDEKIVFDTTTSGTLVDGINRSNFSQSFNVADETNQLCGIAGGLDDIHISFDLPPPVDLYGNGVIVNSGGSQLYVKQDSTGIIGNIPFGIDTLNESSSGDTKGFDFEIDFADHFQVNAGQLELVLASTNLSASVSKTITIEYYGIQEYNYGKITQNGYFVNEADLSGACQLLSSGNEFLIEGLGAYSIYDPNSVNLTDPCNPTQGEPSPDTLIVSSNLHAGLNPNDIITKVKIKVRGEDVASSTTTDDGSGNDGDDGIPGNSITNTSTEISCKLLSLNINGCVFEPTLPLSIEIIPDQIYVKNGDTIEYEMRIINTGIEHYDSLQNQVNISPDYNSAIVQNGGIYSMDTILYPDTVLKRLDTLNYTFDVTIDQNAPCFIDTLDDVENNSLFQSSSSHHEFTPWEIKSIDPFEGLNHWYGMTDTALSIKILRTQNHFVPSINTIFSFWHKYNTQLHQDGGRIELSIDNGKSWLDIGTIASSNGYNDHINNDTTIFAFSGNSNGYIHTTIPLEAFAGQVCLIRFILFSDYEHSVGEWSIDNIGFSKLKNALPAFATSAEDTLLGENSSFPLPILTKCTDVYTFEDDGLGSLREAINCANVVDTISFMPNMTEDSIQLISVINIFKDLYFNSFQKPIKINQNSDEELFKLLDIGKIQMTNTHFLHSGSANSATIFNEGILLLNECSIKRQLNNLGIHIYNEGVLEFDGYNSIQNE